MINRFCWNFGDGSDRRRRTAEPRLREARRLPRRCSPRRPTSPAVRRTPTRTRPPSRWSRRRAPASRHRTASPSVPRPRSTAQPSTVCHRPGDRLGLGLRRRDDGAQGTVVRHAFAEVRRLLGHPDAQHRGRGRAPAARERAARHARQRRAGGRRRRGPPGRDRRGGAVRRLALAATPTARHRLAWDFGDGTRRRASTSSHRYRKSGRSR